MKKSVIGGCVSIALVMVGLPCVIRFVPTEWSMILCVLTFLYINPIFSLGLGIWAGGKIRERWYFPLVSPAVFPISAGLLFTGTLVDGNSTGAFLTYALYYLILGALAMGIRWMLRKK